MKTLDDTGHILESERREKEALSRVIGDYSVFTLKAGFNPNQPRNPDGTWGYGGLGSCHKDPIKTTGSDYKDQKFQTDKLLEYTTFGSENQYKRTIWVNWFLGEDPSSKSRIAYEINQDPDLQHALKSAMYDLGRENFGLFKGKTFEKFLEGEVTLYRGVSKRNEAQGSIHEYGFTSWALNKGLAERYASADGTVVTQKKKVKDLYGAVNIVGGEVEVLEPQPYSDEFAKRLFREQIDSLLDAGFTEDPKGYGQYRKIKKEKGEACAQAYAERWLSGKKSLKAGFRPDQPRDQSGRWTSTGSWHKINLKDQVSNHHKYDGSTYDPISGKDLAYSETELYSVSIDPELTFNPENVGDNLTEEMLNNFLEENKELFLQGGKAVGSWYGADEGEPVELWLDVATLVTNREEAIALGKKHNQVSIFDLKNMEEIKTGGTGKSNVFVMRTKGKKDVGRQNWADYMKKVTKGRKKSSGKK